MRKLIVIFHILCLANFAHAQDNIKKYIQHNSTEILFIDPDSTNFSDLKEIGQAVGNAKVVMMGEQDHGDAPTFLAKSRLIKFLHEEKGFNVLAFESNFFGLNYYWDFVKEGKMNIDTFILSNIYPLWTLCDACKPLLYNYIPSTQKTNNPLLLTGFDNQIFSANFIPVLDSVIKTLNLPLVKSIQYNSEILPLFKSWYKYSKQSNSDTTKIIIYYLSEIKSEMLAKLSPNNFWVKVIENFMQEILEFQVLEINKVEGNNIRDKQMASNLKWLRDVKYPDDKIIVWAHNYHVSKYAGNYPEDFLNSSETMGSSYTKDSSTKQDTYVIGFTSYEGSAGRLGQKTFKLSKPEKNSFENWIDKTYKYSFTDFRKYNSANKISTENFYLSGGIKVPYHKSHKAQWNHIFDGIFFIRQMYPCKRNIMQP